MKSVARCAIEVLLGTSFFFLSLSLSAQSNVSWISRSNGSANANVRPACAAAPMAYKSQVVDSSGNLFVTGCVNNGFFGNDIITYKISGATGAVLWTRSYSGSAYNGNDAGHAIGLDPAGNVVVTGYSSDLSGQQIRTIKYNGATGDEMWSAALAGTPPDTSAGMSLVVDAMGNVVVVGYSESGYLGGRENIRTIKYDGATGAQLWTAVYNGLRDGRDFGYAVALDPQNNVIVTGSSTESAFGPNMRTIKYSGSTGAEMWNATLADATQVNSSARAIAVDSVGNIVVVGTSIDAQNKASFRTVKYNGASGSIIWSAGFASCCSSNEYATAVVLDGDGNAYVTGYSESGDMRVIKYDSITGAVRWNSSSHYDGDKSLALTLDSGGNILVTGSTRRGQSNDNILVAKFNGATGAEIWTATYAGTSNGNDSGYAIAMDPGGNALVTGLSEDIVGGQNIRSIKFSGATGSIIWAAGESPALTVVSLLGSFPYSAKSMALDAVGNVFVTGISTDATQYDNFRTIKYNGNTGAELWSAPYNGTANNSDRSYALAVDASGNVAVTGFSTDAGQGTNMRTVKYNGTSGALIWSAAYKGSASSSNQGQAVAIDAGGNVIVTGISTDTGQSENIRTIKYDASSGAELWNVAYNGSSNSVDRGFALAVDASGNVVVTGLSTDSGQGENIRTIKYDGLTGAVLWSAAYNGSWNGFDQGNALLIDAAGNVIVTGFSTESGGERKIRTVAYQGGTGALLWSAAYGGSAQVDARGHSLALDPSGNVVVAGYSAETGQGNNMRVIKYQGTNGSELWTAAYNGSGNTSDMAHAVAVDPSGNVVVVGASAEPGLDTHRMRALIYDGSTGSEILNHPYASPGIGAGSSVATFGGNAIFLLGVSVEPGLPQALVVQKLTYSAAAPTAPTLFATTAGNRQITVSFTPGSSGSSPILEHAATCTSVSPPGSFSATGPSSPIVVTGLTNFVDYTCKVVSRNAVGTSPASTPSESVTPNDGPYLVSASLAGTGTGRVSSSSSQISCDPTCSGSVPFRTQVSLIANAYNGSVFAGWNGVTCLEGNASATCTFTPTANTAVSATFTAFTVFDIVLEGAQEVPPFNSQYSGSGTVTINPVTNTLTINITSQGLAGSFVGAHFHGPAARGATAGIKIDIGSTSSGSFAYDEADETDILAGLWYLNIKSSAYPNGELRGQLDNRGSAMKSLLVSQSGSGAGRVSISPSGSNCDGACYYFFAPGTLVTLTATPKPGSVFGGWNGVTCTSGNTNTICNFTLDTFAVVSASFPLITTVNVSNTDLNDDGKGDIVWRNTGTGENYLYPMDGRTILGTEGPFRSVSTQWVVAGVGDFDGDGKADLLWRNTSTGENYLYFMDGKTILATEGFIRSVPANWVVAGVGDFDGDGKADILWRNTTTGENYLYFMDGKLIKATEGYTRSVPTTWSAAAVGDFDGDGKADILWRNPTTGENYLYFMDGKLIKATEGYLRSVPSPWVVAGSGDFDGDGKADLLWRNTSTGENYLYFLDGKVIKATEGFIRSVATNWSAASVTDFDGDGKADILWRNTTTGENYMYPMDGRTIKATEGFIRSVPPGWSVVTK